MIMMVGTPALRLSNHIMVWYFHTTSAKSCKISKLQTAKLKDFTEQKRLPVNSWHGHLVTQLRHHTVNSSHMHIVTVNSSEAST